MGCWFECLNLYGEFEFLDSVGFKGVAFSGKCDIRKNVVFSRDYLFYMMEISSHEKI